MSFASRFALGDAALEIGLGFRVIMSLGQHDSVEHSVKSTVSASVETVPDQTGGRSLQRSYAGAAKAAWSTPPS
jgi:hypothetical protein